MKSLINNFKCTLLILLISSNILYSQNKPKVPFDYSHECHLVEIPDSSQSKSIAKNASSSASCAENGLVFTPKGDLRVLVVYAGFKDNPSSNPAFTNAGSWVPDWSGQLPDYVDQSTGDFDEFLYNNTSDFGSYTSTDNEFKSLSNYFNVSSMPKENFRLMGSIFNDASGNPVRVDIDPGAATGWAAMNQLVMQEMNQINPSFNLSTFDQRTNNPNYQSNNSLSSSDNHIDYMIIVYRYNRGFANPPAPGIDNWLGSGGGFASLNTTYNMNGITMGSAGFTMCAGGGIPLGLFIHELGHSIWSAPHMTGANGRIGDYFYQQAGYSTTGNGWFFALNALDRWNLDYIDGVEINQNNVSSGGYLLRDYITHGDALRVEIPFSGGQHLWIENHKKEHDFDEHQWTGNDPGNYVLPGMAKGAYMFIENTIQDKCDVQSVVNGTNSVKFINASGQYDFSAGTQLPNNNWNNVVIPYKREGDNPISGINPWIAPRMDFDGNGIIDINTHFNYGGSNEGSDRTIIVEELPSGTNQPLYRSFGMHNDAFNTYARRPSFTEGDELSMGTNPTIVNYPKYNKNTKKLNTTYLNGLKVRFEDAGNNGDLIVYIDYEYTTITDDTRWSGFLELPDITSDNLDDLVLSQDQKIIINKSGTANRHTQTVDNDFINNTEFVLGDNAAMHLLYKSVVYVSDHSLMTVNPSTKIEIENKGCLVIDETSTLHLQDDNIILNGSARVLVQGNLIVDNGLNFTPSAPLNASFQYDINCNTGQLTVQPDQVSIYDTNHSYSLILNSPTDPNNNDTAGDIVIEEMNPQLAMGSWEAFGSTLEKDGDYYIVRKLWSHCMDTVKHTVYSVKPLDIETNISPDFTYQITNCDIQGERFIKVTGVTQPTGASPYHMFILFEYDPATNTETELERISWWQQSNASNYTYQTGPFTFNTPITPLKYYYVKRGVWDYCTGWREKRIYNIRVTTLCSVLGDPFLQEFAMYPNPASNVVNISFVLEHSGYPVKIDLMNENGEAIVNLMKKEKVKSGEFLEEVNLKGIDQGLYYIKIEADKTIVTKRLIVDKE